MINGKLYSAVNKIDKTQQMSSPSSVITVIRRNMMLKIFYPNQLSRALRLSHQRTRDFQCKHAQLQTKNSYVNNLLCVHRLVREVCLDDITHTECYSKNNLTLTICKVKFINHYSNHASFFHFSFNLSRIYLCSLYLIYLYI